MGQDNDWLLSDVSPGWLRADLVSVREAACILSGIDPSRYDEHRVLPRGAEAMSAAIQRSIIMGTLSCFAAWQWLDNGDGSRHMSVAGNVNIHTTLADCTTVKVDELVAWCERKGIEHPFLIQPANSARAYASDLAAYPEELRAAVEAFKAVHDNPAATTKQTPKAALTAWLAEHKTELTANARERIATVANWLPQGGAPKTPG